MTEFGLALTCLVGTVLIILWIGVTIWQDTKRTFDDLDFYLKENERYDD